MPTHETLISVATSVMHMLMYVNTYARICVFINRVVRACVYIYLYRYEYGDNFGSSQASLFIFSAMGLQLLSVKLYCLNTLQNLT